jgi:Bacterial Ig domain
VQFKIDGGNLGAEDTTAPYAASWSSTNVPNGGHNITAVARDAAGNRSTAQRTVTVSNASGGSTGPRLSWAPPALSNAVTINVTNANRRLFLDNAKDYRLNITEHLKRELWIEGGRNVVVVGGHITIDQYGAGDSYQDNTALKIRYGAAGGTVHVEGLLIDGAYVADGIALATQRNVQIENVRVERTYALKGAHPDCLQPQAGAGAIRIDRFTCSTDLQGIFLRDDTYPIGASDFRHVNITGAPGRVLFWQTTSKSPVSLSDFWIHTDSPWGPFGWWVYPSTDGKTWTGGTDMSRIAVVSADGSYLTFAGSSNSISGRINKGRPPNGDFVSRSLAGMGYASPGY